MGLGSSAGAIHLKCAFERKSRGSFDLGPESPPTRTFNESSFFLGWPRYDPVPNT